MKKRRGFRQARILRAIWEFGLLAFIGILMAAWRNREMSRQADAEIDQAKAALAQSRASEKHADAALAQSRASEKHADAALAQSRTSEKQADIALGQIKNENDRIIREQFSNSVKTLAQNENSKPAIAARVGGIYALQSLANNYVSQYAAQVGQDTGRLCEGKCAIDEDSV